MEKTILEKRIEERAHERFNKDLKTLVDLIHHHPIGGQLTVTIGDRNIPIANFGQNYGLLNGRGIHNQNSEHTNLAIVKENLIEKYKKEETDEILNKLDGLNYLFDR